MDRIRKLDFCICKFNFALLLRAMMLLSPVLILFYQENGLTIKDLLFFQGIFYTTSILAEAPTGYLADIISKRNMLIISLSIFLGTTIFWLTHSGYWVILAGEIMTAISKVFMDNAMPGYLYEYITYKQKPNNMVRYYGYLQFFLSLGTALAAIIGTYLYKKYNSCTILDAELIIILIAILLLFSLPNIKDNNGVKHFGDSLKLFFNTTVDIFHNKLIRYHFLYSGLLTALSIVFATSFQPFMKNNLFPIFMFGVVAFMNHGIRALASVIAGKFMRDFDIHNLIMPLYICYFLAFIGIFCIFNTTNKFIITLFITMICLIIGMQLIFTILHVSRLQQFISSKHRGNLMFVNNLISRGCAGIMLISSKLIDFQAFYIYAFVIFILLYTYVMIKTYQVREEI